MLVDCPPNLGVITLNGLFISDGFIIPTIPDILSTYGIEQIIGRVRDFSKEVGKNITPLGIVASKYRRQSAIHRATLDDLRREKHASFFNTVIKEGAHQGEAAGFRAEPRTLSERWKTGADLWVKLARGNPGQVGGAGMRTKFSARKVAEEAARNPEFNRKLRAALSETKGERPPRRRAPAVLNPIDIAGSAGKDALAHPSGGTGH